MPALLDSALLAQLNSEPSDHTPVWFMRQAGRSLPEYRALRENYGMLEACLTPDVAAEITLQPVRRHGVDAAVFFSDIVIPLKLAGIDVDIVAGVGPVVDQPVRSAADLQRLHPLEPDSLQPIAQAVSSTVAELGDTPLVAFGGAPFTLASYLVEGGPSRELPVSRSLMVEQPQLWEEILSWCADITARFITTQVKSGASVLQVFDSWAGKLSPDEYRQFAAPASRALFDRLTHLQDERGRAVPRIHFGLHTAGILPDMLAIGATAMGVDHTLTLREANQLLGGAVPLQGNINVDLLDAPWEVLQAHIDDVLAAGRDAPGHVANLSHGVPKDTNPDVLTRIVDYIHEVSR